MEEKDDFFDHIKQTLRSHEEDYQEGAWEQFSKKHLQTVAPKKAAVIPIWKWVASAAAAVIGIVLVATYFSTQKKANNSHPTDVVTTIDPKNNSNSSSDSDKTINKDQLPQIAQGNQTDSPATTNAQPFNNNQNNTAGNQLTQTPTVTTPPSGNNPLIPMAPQAPSNPIVTVPQQNNQAPLEKNSVDNKPIQELQPANNPPKEAIAQNKPVQPQQNNQPVLAHNIPSHAGEKNRDESKKWTPSLFVSPMFSEGNVNMGYGVSMGYAVNDKIKVSAGVAYNKLTAARSINSGGNPPAAPTADAPAFGLASGKMMAGKAVSAVSTQPRLDSVSGVLSGFDIPVDITYNVSKKVYASAGVSGMVVTNDATKYTYVTSNNVRVSVENNKGILQEDKSMYYTASNTTSAPPEASAKDRTGFVGFYNFSLGFKQKVTPKNNVAIEPFIKVPMKTVSDQKLNYTGMGLRLKFDF